MGSARSIYRPDPNQWTQSSCRRLYSLTLIHSPQAWMGWCGPDLDALGTMGFKWPWPRHASRDEAWSCSNPDMGEVWGGDRTHMQGRGGGGGGWEQPDPIWICGSRAQPWPPFATMACMKLDPAARSLHHSLLSSFLTHGEALQARFHGFAS